VDKSELRVKEIERLRTADASLTPFASAIHIQMLAYAIWEQAAAIILGQTQTERFLVTEELHCFS
jgi:choline dehydrogenase-like flavoprotein